MSNPKKFRGWGDPQPQPTGTMRELRALTAASQKPPSSVSTDSNEVPEGPIPKSLELTSQEAASHKAQISASHETEESASHINEILDSQEKPKLASHTEQDLASHKTTKPASRSTEETASTKNNVASMLATPEPQVASMLATKPQTQKSSSPSVASHKKDRHAKGKHQLNVRISNDIFQQIKEFCAKHQIPMQDFVEVSASHYIESVASHKEENAARKLAHDDLMIRKTHDDIIMLYSQHTGNRWKPADDRAAERFNTVDRRHIELGILNTLLNAKGKRINSFSYFIPEIEMMTSVALTPETIGVMLRRRREQWATEKGKKK